jgi:hypothetical protein
VTPLTRRGFLAASPFAFAHPGLLHTADDLARMREAVAAQTAPQYAGFQALAAHARSKATYAQANTGQITSWGRGPSNYMSQAVADSVKFQVNGRDTCVCHRRFESRGV